MNYDEARQIGPEGAAPGKWNWTTKNDGVIWTSSPCFHPDMDWNAVRASFVPWTVELTGRERCDHDAREDAERHYWRDYLDQTVIESIGADAREMRRCDYPACDGWQTHRTREPGGYGGDDLCEKHATTEALEVMHPFHPGVRIIHS